MKKRSREKGIVAYALEPHIEICSSDECTIDGIKGITKYSEERITVNLGRYSVTLCGSGLYINSFSSDGATVRGDIISLEFCGND